MIELRPHAAAGALDGCRCPAAGRAIIPGLCSAPAAWSAPSFIARCAFFVLGVIAGGLTGAVFEILSRSAALLAAGVTLLVAAEWLILRKRLFHAGVEEALWTGGLLVLAVHFVPSSAERGLSAAIALTLAVSAMRLLNPFLLTLAFATASVAIELAGGHRLMGWARRCHRGQRLLLRGQERSHCCSRRSSS